MKLALRTRLLNSYSARLEWHQWNFQPHFCKSNRVKVIRSTKANQACNIYSPNIDSIAQQAPGTGLFRPNSAMDGQHRYSTDCKRKCVDFANRFYGNFNGWNIILDCLSVKFIAMLPLAKYHFFEKVPLLGWVLHKLDKCAYWLLVAVISGYIYSNSLHRNLERSHVRAVRFEA